MPESFSTEIVGHDLNNDGDQLVTQVPTLFIGLGGTGKDVLMRLRKKFYDDLVVPRTDYARFLVLDTDMQNKDPNDAKAQLFKSVQLDPTELLDCSIKPANFEHAFNANLHNVDPMYSHWLKQDLRQIGAEAVKDGCGTHRQFGRLAFMLHVTNIRSAIENQLRAATEFLRNPAANQNRNAGERPNRLEIVIVASLAGGTGSGMLIDTAYLVKDIISSVRFQQLRPYTTLIALLPSLFSGLDEAIYQRFKQNGFAALLELEYYGTPKSGDELFLGPSHQGTSKRNRVGFRPPWKPRGIDQDNFIEGAGWEACYLIDNANSEIIAHPLDKGEVFQMVADYLYLDFQGSTFAIRKRSARSNLVQLRERRKQLTIWKEQPVTHDGIDLDDDKAGELYQASDVMFVSHNGCTFSSFGVSEITFDKNRVYRAAGYRLASRLANHRWLGRTDRVTESTFIDWANQHLYLTPPPPGPRPASFVLDELLERLYEREPGKPNWFTQIRVDFDRIRGLPPEQGSQALKKEIAKHEALLYENDKGPHGPARQTLLQRTEQLTHPPKRADEEELGALRAQIRSVTQQHANQFGVATTLKLLEYYRRSLAALSSQRVAKAQQPDPRTASSCCERSDDAGRVPKLFWGRSIAQEIEFPRACDESQAYVERRYRRAAAEQIQEIIQAVSMHIGAKDTGAEEQANLPQLANVGTLHAHYQRIHDFLGKVRTRLDEQFDYFRQAEKKPRKQSLLTTWDERQYDNKIDNSLVPALGRSQSEGHFNFNEKVLEERVFKRLFEGNPTSSQTFTTLSEGWLKNQNLNEEGVKAVSERLCEACVHVLQREGLDLKDVCNGNVIDILYGEHISPDERKQYLENLVNTSAPYLPHSSESELDRVKNFRLSRANRVGMHKGDSEGVSERNEAEMGKLIKDLTSGLQGNTDILDASPTSIVMCSEVYGVPLQYYAHLEELREWYVRGVQGPYEDPDGCHINYKESWQDLPDVQFTPTKTIATIRDNIDQVLLAIVVGTISCTDGMFKVQVPNEAIGYKRKALGTRINRVIKNACQQPGVLPQIEKELQSWANRASERDWALVYCSVQRTFVQLEENRNSPGADRSKEQPSPLENCFIMLERSSRQRLESTKTGKEWLKLVDYPKQEFGGENTPRLRALRASYEQLLTRLIDEDKVLRKVARHIPIYQIDWNNADHLKPPASDGNVVAAS